MMRSGGANIGARQRSRVALTEAWIQSIDRHLEERGKRRDQPAEARDAQVVGLLLRRECTGHLSWHYCYSVKGGRGRIKVGDWPAVGVRDARNAAKTFAAKVVLGTDPGAEKRRQRQERAHQRAKRETLGAFIDGPYSRWAMAHLKSSHETLAALRADFGDRHDAGRKQGVGWWSRSMASIIAVDADEWQTTELVRGNKPTTINRAWQRLHAALAKAVEWNVIPGPLPRLKKLRVDKRGRVRFLSADERARLFAALADRGSDGRNGHGTMNGVPGATARRCRSWAACLPIICNR
jgi:hypothetical protein